MTCLTFKVLTAIKGTVCVEYREYIYVKWNDQNFDCYDLKIKLLALKWTNRKPFSALNVLNANVTLLFIAETEISVNNYLF